MKIKTLVVELHGSYLTESAANNISTLLTSLISVDKLKINLSGTKINKNIALSLQTAFSHN